MEFKIQEKQNKYKESGNGAVQRQRDWDSAEMGNVVDCQQGSNWFFDKSEWLTTAEAAAYLRKFCSGGIPSVNAIHKLVSKGRIRRRKFHGRLYFKRKELAYLIETSEA